LLRAPLARPPVLARPLSNNVIKCTSSLPIWT
jgi:hypothetical protein